MRKRYKFKRWVVFDLFKKFDYEVAGDAVDCLDAEVFDGFEVGIGRLWWFAASGFPTVVGCLSNLSLKHQVQKKEPYKRRKDGSLVEG